MIHRFDSYVKVQKDKNKWLVSKVNLEVDKKIRVFKGQVVSSFLGVRI